MANFDGPRRPPSGRDGLPSFDPDRHRARTDRDLLLGGFGLLLVVGSALAAFFLGGGGALAAAAILVGALLLIGLLYLLLNGLERLAR